jgi:hypothetical protein
MLLTGDSLPIPILTRAMRKLVLLACLGALSTLAGVARGAEPGVGTLSVERGRGVVMLEVRGAVVLGRLASGSIAVTDRTPNDAYVANITGRRIAAQRRLGPARTFVRGQGLRFRMIGGSYRIVIRGTGIALSAVGRGTVLLDGEPRFPGDDAGVYSLDGADCSSEPESESCIPVPDEPVRLKLGPTPGEAGKEGVGTR